MVPRACSAYVGPAKLKIQSVWMVRKGAQCRVSDSMEAESAMSRNSDRLNKDVEAALRQIGSLSTLSTTPLCLWATGGSTNTFEFPQETSRVNRQV